MTRIVVIAIFLSGCAFTPTTQAVQGVALTGAVSICDVIAATTRYDGQVFWSEVRIDGSRAVLFYWGESVLKKK
jgi:hypothetical protein